MTTGAANGLIATLLALAILVPVDVWVYLDAAAHVRAGRPVFVQVGALRVETPQQWGSVCLLLLVVALPLYLAARSAP